MRMYKSSLAIAVAALVAVTGFAGGTVSSNEPARDVITWTITPGTGGGRGETVQFRFGTSNVSLSLAETAGTLAVRSALAGSGPTSFSLAREAGTITCQGLLQQARRGGGSCDFVADQRYEADLRARGLAPQAKHEQLAMALLDVNRAMIDGFVREGVPPRSADDLIAAAGLGLTPAYLAELKGAGLTIGKIGDAIACRALQIDADYVRALAAAGYGGDVQQIIAMKAVGVTPDYARRMNLAVQQ